MSFKILSWNIWCGTHLAKVIEFLKIIDADMGSEKYQALTSLFDEYREIPEDKRKNEGLNADYLSRLRAITDSGN